MQTAENRNCRDAANMCRRNAKRAEYPDEWLQLAENWDALEKTRESIPPISNRIVAEPDRIANPKR
jgi:hypothetical protein